MVKHKTKRCTVCGQEKQLNCFRTRLVPIPYTLKRCRACENRLMAEHVDKIKYTVDYVLSRRLIEIRHRCKRKKWKYDLSLEYLYDLLRECNSRCVLTDIPFVFATDSSDYPKSHVHPFAFSIDRIIPAKGYVKGNIRLTIAAVNMAINAWGLDCYYAVAEAALKHRCKSDICNLSD